MAHGGSRIKKKKKKNEKKRKERDHFGNLTLVYDAILEILNKKMHM
jgi:hypothetical protein